MNSLLKISDAVSIGLHSLVLMAVSTGQVMSAARIAEVLGVSRNHLVKVMQRLTREGLVKTVRGPAGGYMLAVPPENIMLRKVFEALEGRLIPAGCLLKRPVCGGKCLLSEVIQSVNQQLLPFFSRTSIADLAATLGKQKKEAGYVLLSMRTDSTGYRMHQSGCMRQG